MTKVPSENEENAKRVRPVLAMSQGQADDDPGNKAFMQLYASLMILLMTFFIVIYSYSTHSQAKFEMAKDSLYKVFETLGMKETREIISLLKSKLPSEKASSEAHRELLISLSEITKQLENEFGGAEVEISRFQTNINLQHGKIFDGDEVDFNEGAVEILDKIIKHVKKDVYSEIIIAAHYASIRADQKTVESNRKDWLISSMRAIRIADYFTAEGLDSKAISALGHGNTIPIIDSQKLPGAANEKNNRIEISIKKPMVDPAEEYDIIINE
jgi:chemotaxis protein MotB